MAEVYKIVPSPFRNQGLAPTVTPGKQQLPGRIVHLY